jgi:hypothetical protein
MANTKYQLNVEIIIRKVLASKYGQLFYKKKLILCSGGEVEFDAVSDDEKVVGMISTSAWKTKSGKNGMGKLLKIRSDILSLIQLKHNTKKIVILTEKDMYDKCIKEKYNGKIPREISFYLVTVPAHIRNKLKVARQLSIDEIIVMKK